MIRRAIAVLCLGSACAEAPEVSADPALGMNDVSFLLPLEGLLPPLVPVEALVDEAHFEALALAPGDVRSSYEDLVPVAVRVDLCDRVLPGPCDPRADGSLRVVLQASFWLADPPHLGLEDVALHAFYVVPREELRELMGRVVALAALGGTPRDTALQVSPPLAAEGASGPYREALAALVGRYAGPERLLRLTLLAQNAHSAQLRWSFRGLERESLEEPLRPLVIPDLGTTAQEVRAEGRLSYLAAPFADRPEGLALALAMSAFDVARSERQAQARAALVEVDDPARHTAHTTQCASCHVTSPLASYRETPVAPALGPFRPRPFDPNGRADRGLRALGYLFTSPIVSQRVANESAMVALEMAVRFPEARRSLDNQED